MNIHIINIKYTASNDDIANIRPAHREFLDIGYSNGILLASGPKEDKTGGIILATGDIDKVKAFLANDPFQKNNVAEYSFSSFDAIKHAKELSVFGTEVI